MEESERKPSPGGAEKGKRNRRLILWFLALLIGALLIGRLLSAGDISFADTNFRSWNPLWIITSLLSTVLLGFIFQFRFYNLLRGNQCEVGFKQVMAAGMKGWAVNAMTLGGFGGIMADLVRGGFLVGEGRKAGRLALLTLLDRGLGLWAMVSVGVAGICFLMRESGASSQELGWLALFVLVGNLACGAAFLRKYLSFWVWVLVCQVFLGVSIYLLSGFQFGLDQRIAKGIIFISVLPFAFLVTVIAGRFRMELSRFGISYFLAFGVQLLFALILFQVGLATAECRFSDWDYFLVAAPSGAITSLIPLPGNGMGIAETVIAWGTDRSGMQIEGAKVYLLNRFVGAIAGVLVVAAIAFIHFWKKNK